MILSRLDILQVRNLQDVRVVCHPEANVIYGANGSGKTSLLEAIYLLGRGRSFKHRDLRLVISEGATELVVSARVERSPPKSGYQLGVKRTVAGKFEARLDGAALQSSAQLVEALPLQMIDAHSFTLLEGGPLQRRQFLDWGVFHVEHGYSGLWKRFQKALKQRNQLLRHGRMDQDSLSAWTAELTPLSDEITGYRRDYLAELSRHALEAAEGFGGLGKVQLDYYQGWRDDCSLVEALEASRVRDIATGTTNVGAHKADIIIKVDGVPAAERLSRGQVKLLVYALKLAQAAHFREKTARGCVFLLDDLPAELDYQHRGQVVSCLNSLECQYFMTGVDRKDFESLVDGMAHQMFHMEHGVASEG
jgi:DNA replication and repair protein RecF